MPRRRKLLYVPGIISLTGLLFILPYSYKMTTPQKEGVIQFAVPNDIKNENGYMRMFSSEKIKMEIKNKKKIKITLDNDKTANQKKMEVIRYEALKLKFTNDTSTIISVTLTDSTEYSTIVRLINLCQIDEHKRFILLKNSFIIFGEYTPRKVIKDTSFTCFLCNDAIYVKPLEKTFKEKTVAALKPYVNYQTISLLSGLLILIFTSLYSRKKKAPLQSFH
jgi:hypothetical protein